MVKLGWSERVVLARAWARRLSCLALPPWGSSSHLTSPLQHHFLCTRRISVASRCTPSYHRRYQLIELGEYLTSSTLQGGSLAGVTILEWAVSSTALRVSSTPASSRSR